MSINNSLTKKQESNTFSTFITSDVVKKKINEMIGGKDGQKFITSIISAVSTNPSLSKCEHSSIVSAAMIGASLKLSPSPQLGHFYMVPYGNKAQFQLGYKGYIQLATRSGQYKKLNFLAIKEGELISWNPLTEEIECEIIEDDEERQKAKTIGYFGMFEYINGFRKCMYWSKNKMVAHAKEYSKAYNNDLNKGTKYSFWSTRFDEMGVKTIVRQLISKWGIMSIEMQEAYEADNESLNKVEQESYLDVTTQENTVDEFFSNENPDKDNKKGA